MADFIYNAISPQGTKSRGIIKAPDGLGARRMLQKQQFSVISVKEQSKLRNITLWKRVSMKDKIIFTEQLGVMIKSGLSVVDALKSLSQETSNHYFQTVISEVKNKVESGVELSTALSAYPAIFPQVYIQMVKSGEISGSLDDVLKRLAFQAEKDYELVAKVKGALVYPIIITIMLFAVIILIITYIIPKLKGVFTDVGVELPLSTRFLLAISDNALRYGWLAVVVLVLLYLGFKLITKKGRGLFIWHSIKLRIPVFGSFSKKIILARFTQTFSALSGSGVPVLKIFETVENVVTNEVIRQDVKRIANDVQQGVPISFAFKKSKNFPPMIAQMVIVGEKSGEMQEVFTILGNFYEKEVDSIAKNLSTALEPIIMIFMGLGVGFILISVLQPIYGLVSAM